MTWINHNNVHLVEASLVPRYDKFVGMLCDLVSSKARNEVLLSRRTTINNHFNTIDSMLRTVS